MNLRNATSVAAAVVAGLALTTTAGRAAAADAAVEKVVVKSIAHFDFDNDAIRSTDQSSLLAEVGKMKNVTWQTVTATGHTDSVGARSYNERLSKRRAAAIKSYLVSNGIDAAMVRVQGKASDQPIAPNSTEDGRAVNRRTEVQFEGVRTAGAGS